jgi:hypothetical protein
MRDASTNPDPKPAGLTPAAAVIPDVLERAVRASVAYWQSQADEWREAAARARRLGLGFELPAQRDAHAEKAERYRDTLLAWLSEREEPDAEGLVLGDAPMPAETITEERRSAA